MEASRSARSSYQISKKQMLKTKQLTAMLTRKFILPHMYTPESALLC